MWDSPCALSFHLGSAHLPLPGHLSSSPFVWVWFLFLMTSIPDAMSVPVL